MKKFTPALIILAIAILIIILWGQSRSHKLLTDAGKARDAGEPIPVSVATVSQGALSALTVFECVSEANPLIAIKSAIQNPMVMAALAKVGDKIHKGQLLIQFDDRREKAALERIGKNYIATETVAREREKLMAFLKTNRSKGLGLETEYQKATIDWLKEAGNLRVIAEEKTAAQVEYDKTRIVSPVDAVVTNIVAPGVVATQQIDVVTLAVINPILAKCALSDTDYAMLKPELSVEMTFQAMPGKKYSGRFKSINPLADSEKHLISFFAELENNAAQILPGMVATGRISEDKSQATRIPSISLISNNNKQASVFVIDEKQIAHLTTITTGATGSGFVEVTNGLKVNDKVVVVGQMDLKDSDTVNITDPDKVTLFNE